MYIYPDFFNQGANSNVMQPSINRTMVVLLDIVFGVLFKRRLLI